ncbi:hypothetical protein LNKW23_45180 [Paralimibaculum aggregatum]|uniref:Cytochrome P460 domain-containing protein n=1 Tax=Paralimibaculum aggregatum TaxID=3036245 RepID=A0ABQ6LT80_9RHOB|nr:recombinase [Limibaculum sp. NKW23]GMG85300.1 hypothetical protein LNKW23_45180 [Limibaculum sp. NKW23]
MTEFLKRAALAAGLVLAAGAAEAACEAGKPGDELDGAEAGAVYDCLADAMHAGYRKKGKRWIPEAFVNDYRGWTKASAFPAAPGFHAGRFLVTWVNGAGAAEYMKYAEDPAIPAGTVIAKESFSVDDDGKARAGPLFLMQKVEAGTSPETDDWYYMMVAANGTPMAVEVISACSACHQGNYGFQGGLGYPVEEARIGN